MKICDLTQNYTSSSGGIRTYLHAKREYINRQTSHSHVLIVPGENNQVVRTADGVTYHISAPLIPGCEPYRFIWNLNRVRRILQIEKPDIIELGSPYVLPIPVFRHRKQHYCGVIGFYHTDFPTAYVKPFVTKRFGNRIGERSKDSSTAYSRFIYNQCNVTVTSSNELYSTLKRDGIHRVERVYLGVDTDLFSPIKRSFKIRHELGVRDDELLCVYHGRLDVEKRIPMLLESFNKVAPNSPIKLLLIGNGPLFDLCNAAATDGRVILIPYETDRERLAALLASSDIYCTAGPHETFGLSVLEAQSSGLPVCGVNAGALRERITEPVGILSEPDSASSFAEKLWELSNDGFKRRGENAKKKKQEKYS